MKKKQLSHVPGAVGVETGDLTTGALLGGGLAFMGGGIFPCIVDGEGTTSYGGDNAMGLELGDMDGSMSLLFCEVGADAGVGNVFGG